jgi:hypothetical protein
MNCRPLVLNLLNCFLKISRNFFFQKNVAKFSLFSVHLISDAFCATNSDPEANILARRRCKFD